MSVSLAGDHGHHVGLSTSVWCDIQLLAWLYGWVPEGTLKSDLSGEGEWCPYNYWSNDGQIVTASDALNLAAALRRALDSVPQAAGVTGSINVPEAWPVGTIPSLDDEPGEREMTRSDCARQLALEERSRLYEACASAEGQHLLRRLISLGEAGGFAIW